MSLLSIQNISMDFAGDFLFRDLSAELWPGQKVGLIGANGVGKTTLFQLIRGQLEPTAGGIFVARETKIGYLEQHACADSARSMYDELLTVFAPLVQLESEMTQLDAELEHSHNAQDLERQAALYAQFEAQGGLTFRSRARAALLGLGFREAEFSQPVQTLSGGQRSKLSLGKLLLSDADLLLLDEPTNHLDLAGMQWLENLLREYRGACLIVSHDRYFLDQTVTRILRIAHGKLTDWAGSYSDYLQQKQERDRLMQRQYVNDMKEIHRLEGIVEQQRRWRHYITADSKQKMLDKKLEDVEVPEGNETTLRFQFAPQDSSGSEVLNVTGLAKCFGEKRLFAAADLQVLKQERVFLLGPNGCGKTTFLRILTGEQTADSGGFSFGARVRPGYFDQNLAGLSLEKRVIDEIWDAHPDFSQTEVRSALAIFLFTGDEVFKSVGKLSGGEKARLALLKLMLSGANFLLLDEPTNHLDVASREALETALLEFPGTLLVVSHDRYFLKKLSTKIVQMQPQGFTQYLHGYEDYLEKQTQIQAAQTQNEKSQKPNAYRQRKERESELRRLEGRLRRCETEIAQKEAENEALHAQLSAPEAAADYETLLTLSAQAEKSEKDLEALMLEWEALHETLAEWEKERE